MVTAHLIKENLERVQSNISEACDRVGRDADEVILVAVSKTWSTEAVQSAYEAGQRVFGENKLQEAEEKSSQLPKDCDWHFIGHAQRNKVRKILTVCSSIHAIDSIKLASSVSRIAGEEGLIAQVFLQLNVGKEESKFGFDQQTLREVFAELLELPHLKVEGLMAIPPAVDKPDLARPYFQTLRNMREELSTEYSISLPHLSMGMSNDYEVAIEEGSTLVRVGSSIFGSRTYT